MAAARVRRPLNPTEQFKSCLAAAAPAVIPLVVLISADALTMLRIASLDRIGLLAAAVVMISLSYLLWRGRWWAGLPALAVFAFLSLTFAWKAFRPLYAYYQVNPFNGPDGGLMPLMVVSPSLVIVVLAVVLGRLVLRGIRRAAAEMGAPVSLKAWGVLFLWLVLLFGDAAYHEIGWRYVKNPSDLVLRLCLGAPRQQAEARAYLLELGPKAVPALLQGINAAGPGLDCLRERSRLILDQMAPPARQALVETSLPSDRTREPVRTKTSPAP